MIKRAILCVVGLTLLSAVSMAQTNSIAGVWKVTEVTTTGEKAGTKAVTQPSMYIFTKKHYSVIYVASDEARPVPADISKMTADELRAIFVTGFVANAGTYEVKAGKLTMRPTIAKSPNTMKAGAWNMAAITLAGNSMTLVSKSNDEGPVKNPTTRKLVRVE